MERKLDALSTESYREEYADLDRRSVEELVALMNAEDRTVPEAVGEASEQISSAIEAIVERMKRGGRMIYAGAGTSGRLGLLDAAECGPTFSAEPGQVLGLISGGPAAVLEPAESAEDDSESGAADVQRTSVTEADSVIGVSASGSTPYVVGALRRAREVGALTVGVSCNVPSEVGREADHAIEVDTGPEIISGSTRLKAGTAQKLILNTISTVTMTRLGKVFGGLMVDVRPTNDKLRRRARRIVARAAGVSQSEADRALQAAGGETKTAIFALLSGLDYEESRRRLALSAGNVRSALES